MMFAAASATSGLVVAELVAGVLFAGLGYWLSERYRRNWGRSPWGLPSLLWAFIFFLSLLVGAILFMIAQRTTRPTSTAAGGQSPPWYPPSAGGYGGYPSSSGAYPPPPGAYPPPPGPYPGVPGTEQVPPSVDRPSPAAGNPPQSPQAGSSGPQSPAAGDSDRPLGFPAPAGAHPVPATSAPAAYAPPGRPPGYVSPDPGARQRADDDSTTTPPDPAAVPLHAPSWLGDPTLRHELRYWNGGAWTDWVSDGGRTATDPYGV